MHVVELKPSRLRWHLMLSFFRRLFLMLQRFPVESKGRRKKLQEVHFVCVDLKTFQGFLYKLCANTVCLYTVMQVGYVTTICFSCFLIRCVMVSACIFFALVYAITNLFWYLVGRWEEPTNFACILQMCLNAFDKAADLDVLNHPILNFFYYLVWMFTVKLFALSSSACVNQSFSLPILLWPSGIWILRYGHNLSTSMHAIVIVYYVVFFKSICSILQISDRYHTKPRLVLILMVCLLCLVSPLNGFCWVKKCCVPYMFNLERTVLPRPKL